MIGLRHRYCSTNIDYNKNVYKREFIGDMIITDDPNDDWLCISFDLWIGDFVPGCLYINKVTKKTKINYNSSFVCWLVGFVIHKNLVKFSIQKHHKNLLKKILFDILQDKLSIAIIDTPIPCFQQRV
jgi:hypothetical protein